MILLQQEDNLNIASLASVFNDTTNSYKYFWFLSILDEVSQDSKKKIKVDDLGIRMIDYVWYPMDVYLLSFGRQDGFKSIIDFVNQNIEVENDFGSDRLSKQLRKKASSEFLATLEALIKKLTRWVPYRFIRPFFEMETRGLADPRVNNKIVELANKASTNRPESCPYYFYDDHIVINDLWSDYFRRNIYILKSFVFWHLLGFLQKNNPNVPGISAKIYKPMKRNLRDIKNAWKRYLEHNPNQKCIYSNIQLPVNIVIDHFMPWTFVSHDLSWNLVPTIASVNSSKGNKLPDLKKYLLPFSRLQYEFFQAEFAINPSSKILEDYSNLFKTGIRDIKEFPQEVFAKKVQESISPQEQIASNSGFSSGWRWSHC